ncbi:hypothetical protein NHQ30_011615 [Ciborinia camelliae]|nr:hypothetical protein NHQ30_011615 [Ciborinia camelliae]
MKFSVIVLTAAATFVSAVEFPGQPACASPCISQAISEGTNCNIEDVGCQCESSNIDGITNAVIPCILSACTGSGELQQASQAGPSQCSLFSATAGAAVPAGSTTSSAEPGSSSSSGPASTTSSSSAETTSSGSAVTSPATTSQPSNASVTTGSPTPSSTASEVTQNAAPSVGFAGVGAMVGLLAGVVAIL